MDFPININYLKKDQEKYEDTGGECYATDVFSDTIQSAMLNRNSQ